MKPTTIITAIIATALIFSSGIYYGGLYNNMVRQNVREDLLNERNFFKQFKKYGDSNKLQASLEPPILSYGIRHEANVKQDASEIQQPRIDTTVITAQCDVQTIYDDRKNVFEIAISYSKIDKSINQQQDVFEYSQQVLQASQIEDLQEGKVEEFQRDLGQTTQKQAQDLFYLAEVQADSGLVLSIKSEKAYDEDKTMTWVTQQLVNDIFPELRQNSYSKSSLEEDNLGKMQVDYRRSDIDFNTLKINKEYNSRDYTQVHIDKVSLPSIDYDRNIIVKKDTGITSEGVSIFKFQVGENQNKLMAGENTSVEVLGKVDGNIKQKFWLLPQTSESQNIAKEMWRYRQQAEFINSKLSKDDKGSIQIGDGKDEVLDLVSFDEPTEVVEEEDNKQQTIDIRKKPTYEIDENGKQLLRAGPLQFQQVNTLASVKVFGSTIHVDTIYEGYTDRSYFYADAKVNNHVIKRIVSLSWRNCQADFNDHSKTVDFTLFKATFPLLGIIVIPVQAKTRFVVGITKQIETAPRFCKFSLTPYFQASLYADGQASIAGLISAGIYAQGNFLDSNLALTAQSSYGTSNVSFGGNFHAFSLNIGATYTRISCSLKRVFTRNLTEKRILRHHHFKKIRRVVHHAVRSAQKVVTKVVKKVVEKIEKICNKSQGYKQIYSNSSKAHSKTFWTKSFPVGI